MENNSLIEHSKRYWDNVIEIDEELLGCYPLGGGGLVEAPYRYFFEARHLKQIIQFNRTMDVLELGCGNGRWVAAISPLVRHYTAVDFSAQAVAATRKSVERRKLKNVEAHEMSAVEFKPDRHYDIIYFGSITQYLEDSDIHLVLNNLRPSFKPNTVIIDRSTISYGTRQKNECGNYVSVYRTPKELTDIFALHGFEKFYQKRSYRFMRTDLTSRIQRRLPRKFPQLVRLTQPLSLYFLLFMTWVLDTLRPKPWHNGERSHDFFLFKKSNIESR